MVSDKGKKIKLSAAEKVEEENSEQLDGELVHSIEKLQEVQDELEKINEEASDKVLEVEQKYNEMRKPVYEKRSEIIKSIPDFWLNAFLSHPGLAVLLTEEDQKIFKFFSSLEVEENKDVKSGFSITFNFRPNPYFEDTKLTKTFAYFDEGMTKISATHIKWKEGMGLPNGATHKKGKKRSLESQSFFQWFSDSNQDDIMVEIQDEVAEIIREDLWPHPLTYFNNDPDDDEDGDEDDDEERDGDGSDEDDDEEDDDEDDDDDDEDGDDEDGN